MKDIAIDLTIKTSGICEKLGCNIEQFKELFAVKSRGRTYERFPNYNEVDKFIGLCFLLDGNYHVLMKLFEEEAEYTDRFLAEIEIKKAAGTFDQWLKEGAEEREHFVKSFLAIAEKSLKIPAIKKGNRYN